MENNQSENDFLISPCKCSGSCAYVHINCLLTWMETKVSKISERGYDMIDYDRMECEISKCPIPKFVEKRDGTIAELLPFERPKRNYLVLRKIGQHIGKSMLVLHGFEPEGVTIGRSHECEINIPDISISRKHAIIK